MDVCAVGAESGPIVRGRALPILCPPFRATMSIPAPEPPFSARKTHGAEMLLASRALQPSIARHSPRHEEGVRKVQPDGKYGASLGTRISTTSSRDPHSPLNDPPHQTISKQSSSNRFFRPDVKLFTTLDHAVTGPSSTDMSTVDPPRQRLEVIQR